MKIHNLLTFSIILSVCVTFTNCKTNAEEPDPGKIQSEMSLKEAFKDKFYIGTTLNAWQLQGEEPEEINVAKEHFNSIVAENVMKRNSSLGRRI